MLTNQQLISILAKPTDVLMLSAILQQFEQKLEDHIFEDAVKNIFNGPIPTTTTTTSPPVPEKQSFNCERSDCSSEGGNNYAEQLLNTSLQHGVFGTKLLYKAPRTSGTNAADIVRQLLIETLDLPELENSILQAQFKTDGILFEMSNPKDVIEILTQLVCSQQREEDRNRTYGHRCVRPTLHLLHHSRLQTIIIWHQMNVKI